MCFQVRGQCSRLTYKRQDTNNVNGSAFAVARTSIMSTERKLELL